MVESAASVSGSGTHKSKSPPKPSKSPPTSPRPEISWPVNRPPDQGPWTPRLDAALRAREASTLQHASPNAVAKEFYADGRRSLAGIALRAFLLGITLGVSIITTLLLLYYNNNFWRAPFFLVALSIFHFLEFWTTATYNVPSATINSFLLTNGQRYQQAHTVAFLETLITSYFFPDWQSRINPFSVILIGLGMIIIGQSVRSVAMAQAGTNFNHQVQSKRNEGHELVTTGLYAWLRHPAYFGFFWWGLGTQVVLGNIVSFLGYAGVLWYFFSRRITHEEKHLVSFFGDEYVAYRTRTRVWIPFIR
ncbi:prenyl cysteine carboxyl methyltransferas-like protein Ste14 [Glonium stellatum]|uniref:Protein-S-isoprenylcysteine O-methyltransferase n=1 Tax=Glonium stellatum TaxID=574774 RepID=A0A8E2JQK0_9PEZI|nr:prenyl cysteine carboxyl methyltransferas-like protein Ste14 [Glonium stellatum]